MTSARCLVTSYDRVAADYTAHIAAELAGKPLDRALLHAFAEQVGTDGLVADMGCGPGHVAAFLHGAGVQVEGIDASGGMIDQARQRYPNLRFRQSDMRTLTDADATFGGMIAFYSIIHLADEELLPTFQEWWRVLRPDSFVLVAFHLGDRVQHLDTWWSHPVDLDFRFLPLDRVSAALVHARFTITAVLQRAPYPNIEHPSSRAYILAHKEA